jgi:hypothetical protein
MRMKLGMAAAFAAGFAAWMSTGVGAAAQEAVGTLEKERSALREQCAALAPHETGSQEARSRSEVQRDLETAVMNASSHRSGADEPLRRERTRLQAAPAAAHETKEERSVKAATRQEAAQFGVIAVLSSLPRGDADAPSPWAREVPAGVGDHRARDPMLDGTIDTPLRIALSSR